MYRLFRLWSPGWVPGVAIRLAVEAAVAMSLRLRLLDRLQATDREPQGECSYYGAGHAVLRTLYSRACRIVLNEASCLLRGLCKNLSFACLLFDLGRMVGQPTFELVVPFEEQFECFADDVGRICADEFGVSVQVAPDFFL
jgi:hypothetical protein